MPDRGGRAVRVALLSLALLIAACGSPGPTATETPAASSPSPIRPPATLEPEPALVVDPRLLAHVPSDVAGVPIVPAPETAMEIALDPALGGSASAIAVGLFIAPGDTLSEDLAIVSVVRLRDGVFSEVFFRGWRDTYDSGACEQAGGVTRRSETEIGGRITFIGVCAEGVLTYHVQLAEAGLLVAVTALGPRRFGELVIAGLSE